MRLLVLAIAIASPASILAPAAADVPHSATVRSSADNCPQTTRYYAWRGNKAVRPQKLTELPDANAYAAVIRRIGRCEVPVVVRYGVSGGR
jgi:hypothetical protein